MVTMLQESNVPVALSGLRQMLSQQPSEQAFRKILRCFRGDNHFPFEVGLSYVLDHLEDWRDDLRCADINDCWPGFPHTPPPQRLSLVRSLSLPDWGLCDQTMGVLVRGLEGTSLRCLCLFNNRIGDEGTKLLAQSPHLQRLEVLDLGWNQIREEGVRALSESRLLPSLHTLHLDNNPIGPKGYRMLATSKTLPFSIREYAQCKSGAESTL